MDKVCLNQSRTKSLNGKLCAKYHTSCNFWDCVVEDVYQEFRRGSKSNAASDMQGGGVELDRGM